MDGSQRSDDVDEDLPSDSDSFLRAVAEVPDRPITNAGASDSLAGIDALDRLAHFRIEEPIGRGGMGIVFRAEDEKLRRVVALKVLPRSFGDDEKRRRRFMREARLAASISDPNVATVYEIGEADGRIFIAMELVSGVTLRTKIEEGVSVAEARRIAIEVARGVSRAHERGIAHRDLKPDNVMVSPDGAIKVLDFGLAKPTDDEHHTPGDSATLTKEGGIVGTPGYMSPEQATGRALDVRTDVFSLGVILYEMATGTRPFTGETSMDKLIATSRDEHVRASQRNPKVPASLDHVIDRCLAKEPSARFATAADLALALQEVNLDAPAPKSAPRFNVRWAAVGALLASGVVGIWAASHGATQPPPASDPPTASQTAAADPTTSAPIATTTASAAVPLATATQTAPPLVAASGTNATSRVRVAPATTTTASASSARPVESSAPQPNTATSRGGVIQSSPY
jgi:eukaryotic-like serine/threonine-protein kinase